MKIQCSCGAKFAVDISPEMAQTPVRFVCPACGVDSSDMVNELVRQELGLSEPAAVPVPAAAEARQRCFKHPDQFVVETCRVCSKPICPRCMELFGYACSPLCKGKAESQGLQVPRYAGRKSAREARTWRWTVAVAGTVCVLGVAGLGFWGWYAWIASVPKTAWSVRFDERSYSGQSAFFGKDQIVFLHGDTLARHDMKLKKEIWARHLLDKKQIDAAVAQELKALQAIEDKASNANPDYEPKTPNPQKVRKRMQKEAEAALELRVCGQNIWVLSPGKLTRFDRDTGSPVKEIPVPAGYAGLIPRGDELLNVDLETGQPVITHINLTTCETRAEQIGGTPPTAPSAANTAHADARPGGKAGLPLGMPGREAGKVMDPRKVADQAQHLSYAAKIALPAILAHNMNQERTLAALGDQPGGDNPAPAPAPEPPPEASLIPTKGGFVQLSVKRLESRIVTRDAMKPAPAKSVLVGNLSLANTAELSNGKLNELQRSRGGETVREDESRYQVTIRQPDASDAWSGEVIGRPSLLPLATVNVLTADKMIMVFDKRGKPLWQSALSYNVTGSFGSLDAEHAPYGLGPCVERKGSLYVFDEGVLTAFDLATGAVRWRLPSIGITGLFFDDEGMIYMNTTTASPDTIKYSNQIDITQKSSSVVMKIEPRTGKVLWSAELGGLVNYVSGKFIYSMHSYQADDDEDSEAYTADSMAGRGSELVIKRINPRNGHVMWHHTQERAPVDVQFDQNTIRLVFRKEVQVLTFLAL